MVEVLVMGRAEVQIFRTSKPHINAAYISVSDVDIPPLQFNQDDKVLILQFNDEDWEDFTEEKQKIMFKKGQAKKIFDFVNKYKNEVDYFIVNCHAGISRSGAIGLWIVRYLGLDENEFLKKHPLIMPNKYVLNILEQIRQEFS